METWHPRARRYPFTANIELTDLESEARMVERTTDLSLYGCCVKTQKPLPSGTKVRIKTIHGGASFVSQGEVAHSKPGEMGIVFAGIEQDGQSALEKWLSELRSSNQ